MPWSCEVHALTGWLLDYLSEKTLDAKSCLDVLELPRFQFIPWLLCSFWLYVRFVSFVQQSLPGTPGLGRRASRCPLGLVGVAGSSHNPSKAPRCRVVPGVCNLAVKVG